MGNGNILQQHVEPTSTGRELLRYGGRYQVSLRQQLIGVITGNNCLCTFIHKTWKNALIIVQAEMTVDPHEMIRVRTVQHTYSNCHHLQIFGSSQCLQIHRPRSDVVYDRPFKPRNIEIQSFVVDEGFHSNNAVEDDGAVTSVYSEDGVVGTVSETSCDGESSNGATGSLRSPGTSTWSPTSTSAAGSTLRHVLGHFLESFLHLLRHSCK
mmetsp:Transcript_3839/g.7603  ORF Transcript_3839/g.7603 Transcript_3839/m.7603 type:complete len:210 (-) Transcript_3839:190-819(-)